MIARILKGGPDDYPPPVPPRLGSRPTRRVLDNQICRIDLNGGESLGSDETQSCEVR